MTCVKLQDACVAKFECDTAASHNVISVELCNRLRQMTRIPSVKSENVSIKLADGTKSRKPCGSITLKVEASNSSPVELSFFVLERPNNLLGRLALEQLWPVQYKALRDVASFEPSVTVANVKVAKNKSVKVIKGTA